MVIAVYGCSEKNVSTIDVATATTISIDKAKKGNIELNKFIKNISLIVLQGIANDDFIAEIHSVFNIDNKFFVFDKKKSNIFVFDASGMLINKIGVRGNGPGEYNKISDFSINRGKKEVAVVDENSMAVLTYDFQGNFIKKIKFDSFFPRNIAIINNNYIFSTYNSNMNFNDLVFTDLTGKILNEEIPYPKDHEYFGFDYTGGINNKSKWPLYQESLSSIIYEIKGNNIIKAKYNIDLGKSKWPEEKIYSHLEYSEFNNKTTGTDLLAILENRYIENNKYFVFRYTNDYQEIGFFNKKTKELFTSKSIENYRQYLYFFSTPIGLTADDKFISGLYPDLYHLLSQENKGFTDDLMRIDTTLAQILKESTTENNPILMIHDYN